MKKQIVRFSLFIFYFLFFIAFLNITYSQNVIYSVSKDLALTSKFIYNEIDYEKIKLINADWYISGYLVIQIDSNTSYIKYTRDNDATIEYNDIQPTFYFINQKKYKTNPDSSTLDSALYWFDNNTNRIYDCFLSNLLVQNGRYKYLNGEKDVLSNFLYYYYIFSKGNCNSTENKWIRHVLKTDLLNKKTIWRKVNDNIGYIIYEVSFQAALFELNQKKFFLPMSCMNYFKEAQEDYLKEHGYVKSNDIIIVN